MYTYTVPDLKHNIMFVSPRSAVYKATNYFIEFSFENSLNTGGAIDTFNARIHINDGKNAPILIHSLKLLKNLSDRGIFAGLGYPIEFEFIQKELFDIYQSIIRIDKIEKNSTILEALKFEGDII